MERGRVPAEAKVPARGVALRHNRCMPRVHAPALALLLAGLLAGCARDDAVDAPRVATDARPGAMEWRGSLPCVDCEAIDTRLLLERRDGRQRYEMVEVYVAVEGSMSFEEAGDWRIDDALLSLEPDTGGLRRYVMGHGGRLQMRDLGGRVIPGREREFLQPVGHRP